MKACKHEIVEAGAQGVRCVFCGRDPRKVTKND